MRLRRRDFPRLPLAGQVHPVDALPHRFGTCHGQPDGGAAVAQDGLDAGGRLRRVDGHPRRAGPGDGPHRERPAFPARHGHGDHVAAGHAARAQFPGDDVGAGGEPGVGPGDGPGPHGDGAGVGAGGGGQELRQRARRRGGRGQRRRRGGGEVADGGAGVGERGAEQRDVVVEQRAGGGGVEQVGGVHETHVDAAVAVAFGDVPGEIELRGRGAGVEFAHAQAGQLRQVLPRGHRAVGEQHLEQRMVGAADRRDPRDDPVERDVRVREGVEVGGADAAQQVPERLVPGDGRAQGEGADEHADEGVQARVGAPGDSGADGDVGAAAAAGEQRGERRVQHHEAGRVVGPRDVADATVGAGVEVGGDGAAAVAGPRGPGPVGGQRQRCVGQARESRCPVVELAGGEAVRVRGVAEQVALPAGVVAVAHGQRPPDRLRPGDAGGVGVLQVRQQRRDGAAVERDVVDRGGEHPFVGAEFDQPDPQRRVGGEVERRGDHLGDGGGRVGARNRFEHRRIDFGRDAVGVGGAQDLVPGGDVGDGRGQRGGVEVTGQVQRDGHGVGGAAGLGAAEEPQSLLRGRERGGGVVVIAAQRDPSAVAVADVGGECREGRCLQHGADGHVGAEGVGEAGGEDDGGQRVTAGGEEPGVDVGPGAEHALGDGDDEVLDVGERPVVGGRVPGGVEVAQGCGVEFAVDGGGQFRQQPQPRRHAVRRHHVGELGEHAARLDTRIGGGEGDERTARGQRDGVPDAGLREQGGLEFPGFDAHAADLELPVGAAPEGEGAVGTAVHQVAGAVAAGAAGGGDEPLRGEGGGAEVAERDGRPGQVQLADGVVGHRAQAGVEHVRDGAGDGPADAAAAVDVGEGRDDGGLGGPVRVEHVPAVGPAGGERGRQGFAAGRDDPQVGQLVRVEGAEHRGGGQVVGDALRAQQPLQVLPRVHLRRGDDEGRAGGVGEQDLEQGRVERRMVALQHAVAGSDAVAAGGLGGERGEAGVGDGDALGRPGRARGRHDVRDVRRRRAGRVGGAGERGAGLGDRPQPQHVLEAAGPVDGHDGAGAGAGGAQFVGERVGAGVEFAVGQRGVALAQGFPVGVRGGGGAQQVRQGSGRDGGGAGQRRGGTVDGQVADGGAGRGDEVPQDGDEPVREPPRGGSGEPRRVVHEGAGVAVRGGRERELQVEFRCAADDLLGLDGEVPDPGGGEGEVLQGERNLRGAAGQAGEDLLVGHPGVVEGGDVEVADLREEPGERHVGFHAGAQHEGLEERADEVLDLRPAAGGDHGGDGDVVSGADAGEQHRQRGVQHHELGGAVGPRELCDPGAHVGGHLERDGPGLLLRRLRLRIPCLRG